MNIASHSDPHSASQEYLTFALGEEEYAIDILTVQEIRGFEPVTRIVHAPPFIKGVINLRGAIVPIVDLRIKLALEKVEYSPFTVVIIISVAGRLVGAVVDSVSDVIRLAAEEIAPPPEMGAAVDIRFITGLATVDQRMVILLDIAKLMTSDEMKLIEQAAG